jgi:diguanylate cyclase (GGDEF)-like protein/PAS domain S-box-containing protein
MFHSLFHSEHEFLTAIIIRSGYLMEAGLDLLEALSIFKCERLSEAIVWENNQCLGVLTERDLLYALYDDRLAPEGITDPQVRRVTHVMQSHIVALPYRALSTFDDLRRYRTLASSPPQTEAVATVSRSPQDPYDIPYMIFLDDEDRPCGLLRPEDWQFLDHWQIPTLHANCHAAQTEIAEQKQQADLYRQELELNFKIEQLFAKVASNLQATSSLELILQLVVEGVRELLGCDRAIVHQFPSNLNNPEEQIADFSVSEPRWHLDATALEETCLSPESWSPVLLIDDVERANLSPNDRQLLAQLHVQSLLAVVITVSDHPWGMLAVHRCAEAEVWQKLALSLLQHLATLIGLAIEQSSVFDQLEIELQERWRVESEIQSLKEQLEVRMTERGEELSKVNLALERQVQEHLLLVEKWRTSESEVRAFFEAMTEIVLILDADLNVLRIAPTSPQLLYGDETNIFTQTVEMFCDSEQISPYKEILRQAITSKIGTSLKYQLSVDGQSRWFYARISPVADQNYVAWVAQDITALELSEAARIETETRLGLLLDGVSNYGIFELDLNGTIASWNTGAERIHGYTEADAIGQPYDLLFGSKGIQEQLPQQELDLARTTGRYEGEGSRKHQSGRSVWVDVTTSALYSQTQEVRGFAVVVRDTSEERRAKVWQKLLERAINASANGVIITDATHPSNPIVYVNSGFETMTGYSEYEAIGRNCRFLQGDDSDQPGLRTLRQALANEQGCRVTLRNYRKDGSIFWNELTISPIKNDSGLVTHFIGIQTDTTVSHERKIELATVGAKLQAVFDSACDVAIFSTASDGKIQLANIGARKLLGCPDSTDLQQFSLDRFFLTTEVQQRYAQLDTVRSLAEAPPRNFECLARCCNQNRLTPYEWKLQRYDGTTICVSLEIAPIYGDNQQIFGFVAIAQDITERSRMQTELRQSKMLLDGVLNSSVDGIVAFQSVRDPESRQIVDFQCLVSNAAIGHLIPSFKRFQIGKSLLQEMPEHGEDGLFAAYVSVVERGELFEQEQYCEEANPPVWLQLTAVKLGDGFAVTFRNITKTKAIETILQETNDKLQQKINVLDSRNRDMLKLGQINEYLQASETVQDAYNVVAAMMPDLLGDSGGGIYQTEESGQLVCIATWGDQPPTSAITFDRGDCWALRRSHHHWVDQRKQGLMCPHITDREAIGATLCIPLIAQGTSLGLLHLWSPDSKALNKAKRQLAYTVAEQLALSVTNLLLRESLELQSTRDPLTGLFNRRYMENALERLLYKAQANTMNLGIIMIDIDRFKSFNDRYGHAVGDLVLREVAQLLPKALRQSDIACRYGGEELMAILPDASAAVVYRRAEQLRSQIAALKLTHDGNEIEPVTASFGVSVFPECGRDRRDLLRVADDALYRAKRDGRNCVRLAEAIAEMATAVDPLSPPSSEASQD